MNIQRNGADLRHEDTRENVRLRANRIRHLQLYIPEKILRLTGIEKCDAVLDRDRSQCYSTPMVDTDRHPRRGEYRQIRETKMNTNTDHNHVHCECGEWTGERCAWTGPVDQTVIVEYMPEYYRASHAAAGNHGVYPHNGAVRVRVERSCAELLLADESEQEWARIVGRGTEDR